MLIDPCGRPITYLRLSVTASCDLRCMYCRPSEGAVPKRTAGPQGDCPRVWTPDRIETLARAAVAEGITHLRLTGGEPLQRPDLPEIIARLSALPGLQDLGLTTNGQRLAERLPELLAAGLKRINISLDSLDADTFARLTGGSLQRTHDGLMAALEAGLSPVKVNTVLLRGYNDSEVPAFAELARAHGVQVRFIELMPIGPAAGLADLLFYPAEEVFRQLQDAGLGPEQEGGPGPARAWQLGRGTVGVIATMSAPSCVACNRLRVTAGGTLRPCLTGAGQLDLRPALSADDPEAALRQALREGVAMKPERGGHLDGACVPELAMCQIGG
jgi:cyclic pyranopterin phosphate synthase